MTRNSGSGLLLGIVENGVARAFAEEFAALLGKVADKVATLHARASDPNGDGFSSRVASTVRGHLTIGLKNQPKGFPQVAPGFSQSPSLGVHAGDFFDVGDVPPVTFLDHRCEFPSHFLPQSRL